MSLSAELELLGGGSASRREVVRDTSFLPHFSPLLLRGDLNVPPFFPLISARSACLLMYVDNLEVEEESLAG